jgi:selenocysteine lyase/cysteine desulfurase
MNQLSCQKHLFSLPDNVHYLNCATMSPNLRSVEQAGIEGILRKSQPYQLSQERFFEEIPIVKQLFAQLINCPDPERIAIIPSVSYGMATVANNLVAKRGQHILTIQDEFPSDIYAWDAVCAEKGLHLCTIPCPQILEDRAKHWNEHVLSAINQDTCMVVLPHTHWTDGTKFDLVSISKRAKEVGALMVVDGTQSVGALPFDLQTIQPDALVCAGYKFMMGPYSLGLAYYGEYFDTGLPIEQSWTNRIGSDNFRNLIDYQPNYRSKSYRFSVGEQSNFILLPMLIKALEQLLAWTPEGIQQYTTSLIQEPLTIAKNKGYWSENQTYRGSHLFGLQAPHRTDLSHIYTKLQAENIHISLRGNSIRVSPHVYNNQNDLDKLVEVLTL